MRKILRRRIIALNDAASKALSLNEGEGWVRVRVRVKVWRTAATSPSPNLSPSGREGLFPSWLRFTLNQTTINYECI